MKTSFSTLVSGMKKSPATNFIGIALAVCAAAIPGYGSTATGTINFSGLTGGAISASTTVGGVVNASTFTVPFNQLVIGGAGDAADDGTWLLTGTNLTMATGSAGSYNFTLAGTVGTCVSGACLGGGTNLGGLTGTFETFTVGGMLEAASVSNAVSAYNVSGGTSFTMEFGNPTSLADSVALLSKLGETGGTTTPSYATNALGNINGTGTTASGIFTGSATSSFDDTTVTYTTAATPEPVSFILLGSGLLGVGLVSLRRSAARA